MAQRRMFSKDITGTDAFLEMPISSQLLYFHLGMEADDDGFVGSPKKVSRTIGCGDDDLKILLTKRFILLFPTGVVVIKHWKINNYIQSDRYHETKYLEEKKSLITKENGSYTECIQDVSIMDTQSSLGKSRARVKIGDKSQPNQLKDKPMGNVRLEDESMSYEDEGAKPPKRKKRKDADLLELFRLFQETNNPQINALNNTDRKNGQWLIDHEGLPEVLAAARYAIEQMSKGEFPLVITNPTQLRNKYAQLKLKLK